MDTLEPIETWSEDRSPLIVATALLLMVAPEIVHQWLKVVASGDASKYLGPVPHLRQWLGFYSSENDPFCAFLDKTAPEWKPGTKNGQLFRELIEWAKGIKRDDVTQFLQQSQKPHSAAAIKWNPFIHNYVTILKKGLTEFLDKSGPLFPKPAGNSTVSPEIQFIVRVSMPCWILTGRSVYEMVDLAKKGDYSALETMLQIDKGFLYLREIGQIIHSGFQDGNKSRFQLICSAFSSRPKCPNRKKLKYLALGMLSLISQRMNIRLDQSEIRELADAIAYVRSAGDMRIDPDIPETPESLTKAIQRGRKEFLKSRGVDKETYLGVHANNAQAANVSASGETDSGSAGTQPDEG